MPKRNKSVAVKAPQNDAEAREMMAELGKAQRLITEIETRLSNDIAAAKQAAEGFADPHKSMIKACTEGLKIWAEANRDRLTNKGKRKHFELGTGKISWRIRPPSISIRGQESVIEQIKRANLKGFLNTKFQINKNAMLADPDRAVALEGVTLNEGIEDFVAEPLEEAIEKGGVV